MTLSNNIICIFSLCFKKLADDRSQKAQGELKHTLDILHEEQERVVKIESIKKALEIDIKNLTIRLEEVETNALVSSKRIISKLEARVINTWDYNYILKCLLKSLSFRFVISNWNWTKSAVVTLKLLKFCGRRNVKLKKLLFYELLIFE